MLAQETQWLAADLAADAWWKLLYQAHATLVLNGHEHYYARFRPMDPAGHYDPQHGITQITVSLHPHSYSWDYKPALTGPGADPATAMSYRDSGSAACRG